MPARHPIAALAATAAALVLLSGCAGIGAQSKVQACAGLAKTMSKASGELSSAFDTVQSDPTAAHAAVVSFNGQLKGAITKVSNPDVKKAAQKAADDVDTMAEAMQSYKPGSDPAALETAATTVQHDFTAIGKVCSKP